MKTKIIPFDLEMAMKIQAGIIEGKIKTRCGYAARILCTDLVQAQPVLAAFVTCKMESVSQYTKGGRFYISGEFPHDLDLVLEVPDNEPQFNSPYSIEQLNKLKEYTEQLMEVNQGVIDDLSSMIQELRKTCNLSLKTEFKPFDKVLVRENDASLWRAGFYSHKLDGKHCVCGNYYLQCISYEGNQHLVGTINKPVGD